MPNMMGQASTAKARRLTALKAWRTRRRNASNVEVVSARIIRNRIKETLAAKGITQEELARRTGKSYRHINRLVLHVSEPSFLLAKCIETVLGVRSDRLFIVKVSTRACVRKHQSKAALAREKKMVSGRQRAAAFKAWQTRRARFPEGEGSAAKEPGPSTSRLTRSLPHALGSKGFL